jgi:hypothetical protein
VHGYICTYGYWGWEKGHLKVEAQVHGYICTYGYWVGKRLPKVEAQVHGAFLSSVTSA